MISWLGALTKLALSCLSVRMEQLSFHCKDFHEILYCSLLLKYVEKFQFFFFNLTKRETFYIKTCGIWHDISLNLSWVKKSFELTRKIKIPYHIKQSPSPIPTKSHAFYGVIRRNVEQSQGLHLLRRKRGAIRQNTGSFAINFINCFWYSYACSCIANTNPNCNKKMQRFLTYLFLQTLYMFQAVPPPIIRST